MARTRVEIFYGRRHLHGSTMSRMISICGLQCLQATTQDAKRNGHQTSSRNDDLPQVASDHMQPGDIGRSTGAICIGISCINARDQSDRFDSRVCFHLRPLGGNSILIWEQFGSYQNNYQLCFLIFTCVRVCVLNLDMKLVGHKARVLHCFEGGSSSGLSVARALLASPSAIRGLSSGELL